MPNAPIIYAGPGKLNWNGAAFQANDTNGQIIAKTVQDADPVAVSMFGRGGYLQGNVTETIDLTPFANWGLLPYIFPVWLGVSCGAAVGQVAIGQQPHNPMIAGVRSADIPATIWTPDGRLYSFPRAAITKFPDLNLGANKPLFGAMQLVNILASGKKLGDAGGFHSVVENGAADPGGAFTTGDYESGAWFGAWQNAAAGFGGDGGNPLEAEDGFTITTAVKMSPLPVAKLVRAYKLDEVYFMAKGRLYGPSHTQITNMTGINAGRTLGSFIPTAQAADLIFTGPNAKTVTLKNADIVGAGFDFGGTKLGTNEVGFVTGMKFTAGVPQPLIVFSA